MNKLWTIGLLIILLVCGYIGTIDSEPVEVIKYQCADNTFVNDQADCKEVEPIIKRVIVNGTEYICGTDSYDCNFITEVEWQYR